MTFCPKCGADNEERAKFCIGCGIKIEKTQLPPPTITIVKKEFPFQPKPLFIIAGIIAITIPYLLPIHTLHYPDGQNTTVTTAAAISACSMPGWNCGPYIGIAFYLLWIIGLGLIVFGIFQKKPAAV